MAVTPLLFDWISRPRRLSDEAAISIFDALQGGQLRSGDQLPAEADLSKRFGVARTVVR